MPSDTGNAEAAFAPRDALGAEPERKVILHADTPVSRLRVGPYEPLAVALLHDARLRDAFARDFTVPSLRGRARCHAAALLLGLLPTLFLVLLDVRAATFDAGAGLRPVVVDALLGTYVAVELSRATPRLPWAAALALAAVGLRWALVVTRLCGQGVPTYVYVAPASALAAAVLLLVRTSSRERVVIELLDRVGVAPREARRVWRGEPPPGPLVGYALAASIALPAVLLVLRDRGVSLVMQTAILVGYALGAALLGRRLGNVTTSTVVPRRLLWAIGAGFVVTAATMTCAKSFFDTGIELARCVGRLDEEARVLATREASELSSAVLRVRASPILFALTALVMPFVEERIYRGLLQETLARRYGGAYGLVASAIVFGVAHVGVYQIGLYQTIALGLALGATYLEGGLVSAVVVHAAWNIFLLV